MKTYHLGSGSFWTQSPDEDCYCALGILMAERGYENADLLSRGWLIVRGDLIEDVGKMADYLRSQVSAEEHDIDPVDQVYVINDASASDDNWRSHRSTFPPDVIQGALKAAGIEVELIDKRCWWTA